MGMNEEESNQYERLQDLKKRLEKPSQSKVVLVGDVMLDRYIHGYANDLNSRAPVPVLKETNRYDDVGAAAHVARGLESLGLHALLHGVIGKDSAGKIILDSLNEEGVDCKHIKSVENKVTTVKNRLIASRPSLLHNEQLLLRWDIENREDIPSSTLEVLIEEAVKNLDEANVLIISDYGHGVVNDEGAKRLIQRAKEKEIPVIYDPKLTGLHRTHEVDWVIFQSRGLELVRRRINAEDSADCARKLLDEYNWGHLMVLGGADGVTVYTNDDIFHTPCTLTNPLQVIGLIDAACTAVASAVSLGIDIYDCAHLANAACEVIMGQMDNFTLSRENLCLRLDELSWNLSISQR